MKAKSRGQIFWIGIILLVIPGLLLAYLLMPFPGSQELNAITICYYLSKIVLPLRVLGGLLIIWYLIKFYSKNLKWGKVIKTGVLLICLGSFYITDYMFKAETMFEEPQEITFANAIDNKVPESYLVIGVVNDGVAKAYPVVYLGYHHKVQDNVGNEPVLITYCTMCRTGRVYSPMINGTRQKFRLVGARHYNAIVEDSGTGTWWYQATGNAAAGKLKGSHLLELPYEQSTLSAWLNKHPGSLILQPDKHYVNDYSDLKNYDRVQAVDKDSAIKNKDSLMRKSWMVGIIVNGQPKAYNWRNLSKVRIINDEVNKTPLLVAIEPDSLTFHVFNTTVNGKVLHFNLNASGGLTDQETTSTWNWNGEAISGALKGNYLNKIQAYQEYWHSWYHFHPGTLLR